ncbi:MAG: hypothetical protein M3Y82_15205 [Verrucomicrobiota bacterium]|nr:hypothetical protein [Verrucomicrobiota bacterium]
MKKVLIIIFIGIFLTLLLLFFRFPQKSSDVHVTQKNALTSKKENAVKAFPLDNPTSVKTEVAALRAAVAARDREALDRAKISLISFINAHPGLVDDYVAVLQSEQNEHVLRAFALALAETEVGLLANDKIISAAIQLAKDSSFEQRQHIMLNLMAKFPEMRDNVFQTVLELSQHDPNSQVKTSAVVVLADWMERFPDKKESLLEHVGQIFKTAADEDVRVFTYQILALHSEQLPRELQTALVERLKTEPDSFNANLLATALAAAPEDLRQKALAHLQTDFEKETNLEKKRNQLAQIVCLAKKESGPLLEKISAGDSLLAQDARDYLALLSAGKIKPEALFQQKAIRDANRQAGSEPHRD